MFMWESKCINKFQNTDPEDYLQELISSKNHFKPKTILQFKNYYYRQFSGAPTTITLPHTPSTKVSLKHR